MFNQTICCCCSCYIANLLCVCVRKYVFWFWLLFYYSQYRIMILLLERFIFVGSDMGKCIHKSFRINGQKSLHHITSIQYHYFTSMTCVYAVPFHITLVVDAILIACIQYTWRGCRIENSL